MMLWLAAAVTFYKDALPILQQRCQDCHRQGEAAPMAFDTYAHTRPWARAIREAVLTRRMPPWDADPTVGRFANDLRLTQREIDTLAAWVAGGAKEGRAADAPPPRVFSDGWNIGTPDLVLEMPAEFSGLGNEAVQYQHFVVPTGFTEDRWIERVEVRPGNRALVHHIGVFLRPPESHWLSEA